ncbi:MAG: class I SAM-dependent methyltransferase [Opitutales bacterium]
MNAVIEELCRADAFSSAGGTGGSTLVQRASGLCLHQLVVDEKLDRTLEVGLAHGLSALFICQAHADRGRGRHIAIDPGQENAYADSGVNNLERAGLSGFFELRREPSARALPRLLDEGVELDLAFIDGFHTFDHALVDFFFLDQLVRTGGYVVFEDVWMPSIRKAANFVRRNRAYELVSLSPPQPVPLRDRVLKTRRRFLQTPFAFDWPLKLQPTNLAAFPQMRSRRRAWIFHRAF